MSNQKNTTKATFHQNMPWRGIIEPAKQFSAAFVERPIVAVDIDEVLRDHIGAIIDAALLRYGDTLTRCGIQLTRAQFNTWDPPLGELCGVSNEEWTRWAWGDPDIFDACLPVEGAAIGMRWLMRHYQVHIVTSTRYPDQARQWLAAWWIEYHQFIHTADKMSVPFWRIIDDRPSTLAAAGDRAIRFAVPWNEHLAGMPTLADWSRVRRVFGREPYAARLLAWAGGGR